MSTEDKRRLWRQLRSSRSNLLELKVIDTMYVKVFGDSESVEEESSQRSAVPAPEQDELWEKRLRERSEIVLKKLSDAKIDQGTPRQENKERLDTALKILRGNLRELQETTNAVRGIAPLLAKSERIRMVVEKRKAEQLSQTEEQGVSPERKAKKPKT